MTPERSVSTRVRVSCSPNSLVSQQERVTFAEVPPSVLAYLFAHIVIVSLRNGQKGTDEERRGVGRLIGWRIDHAGVCR